MKQLKCSPSLILLVLITGFVYGGALGTATVLHPISGGPVSCLTEARFSPMGGTAKKLIEEIVRAERKILIAAYGLNNPAVVDALIRSSLKGVDISIKIDQTQSAGANQKQAIKRLRAARVTVMISRLSRLLHDKFMVVDSKRVWTGSYNLTMNAERHNRENAVILECESIARLYEQEWAAIE